MLLLVGVTTLLHIGFLVSERIHDYKYAEDFEMWVVVLGNDYADTTRRSSNDEQTSYA